MLKKKVRRKRKLPKKLLARKRMKRVQLIMNAIRIHQRITNKIKSLGKNAAKHLSLRLQNKMIKNKTARMRGMIATSKKNARDRWLQYQRAQKQANIVKNAQES
jgi:hypothetical protein